MKFHQNPFNVNTAAVRYRIDTTIQGGFSAAYKQFLPNWKSPTTYASGQQLLTYYYIR
jgi:hypothetical protein